MTQEKTTTHNVPKLRFPEFRNAGTWEEKNGNLIFKQISNKQHNSDLPVLAITQEHGAIPRDKIDYHVSVTSKRQNQLLPEHIKKIVDTYKYRKEEKRYSRCVSMEEIEKNDYNLNISRYISTAKPEEKINLDEVNTKLVDLEKKITITENKHNDYLKELGLPSLP